SIEVQCARAGPVFDLVRGGVRGGPCIADSVHCLFPIQIDDDSLQMEGVTFASKSAGQVGVALPVSKIRTLNRTITACREPAMGQCVYEDVADRLSQVSTACEIPAAMCGITPSSVLCPVPGRHAKFGVVAIW